MNTDSIAYVKFILKWRKINGGFTDNNKKYAQIDKTFNDCIPHPKYKELGIDSLDINTDVTLVEWVDEFENYYGKIELDSCDYTTHFDSVYTCGEKFDVDFRPIMVDYRNEQVVKKIKDIESNKLVILFGAAHISGIRKLLKKHTANKNYM